jgi:predicted transcriptional regulator of viral defense system
MEYLMKKADILNILKTTSTVFTFKDLLLASGETNSALLRRRISYYIKMGYIYPIRRGIYGKDKNYDIYELAAKIYTPSYISFETVLAEAGIIFQRYSQIFIASYQTKDVVCDGQIYSFRKIKGRILTHQVGIENKSNYCIASVERAFLDVLYLNKDYHFDNLLPLNWDKVFEILPIYGNKRMVQKVNQYFKSYKSGGE